MENAIRHELHIEPGSEAELYFMEYIIKICKDRVGCRIGAVFGRGYNTYVITDEDYRRVQQYLQQ